MASAIAAALEFENLRKDDPQLQVLLEERRARNGGKLRVGPGGKGVRVMFSNVTDMAVWKGWAEAKRKETLVS
jgi:hypothetical protein